MPKSEDPLVDRLLVEGLVDWLDPAWIASQARDAGVSLDEDVRAMTLGAVAVMLFGGLAVAGDVTENGFEPWKVPPAEAMARIAAGLSFIPVGTERPGDVFWLSTTASGEAQGRQVREAMRDRRSG